MQPNIPFLVSMSVNSEHISTVTPADIPALATVSLYRQHLLFPTSDPGT